MLALTSFELLFYLFKCNLLFVCIFVTVIVINLIVGHIILFYRFCLTEILIILTFIFVDL